MTVKFDVKEFINQYELVFDKLNEKYFSNELPKVILTVNQDVTKGAYGWCTAGKVWTNDKDDNYYEINLCAEYCNRSSVEIAGTIFHEMIHLYNLMHEVVDTSGNGYYHNRHFKEACEKFGLIVEKTNYGFSKTTMNEDHIKFVETLGLVDFEFYRKKAVKVSKPNKSKKYQCPCCGASFWSSKVLHVLCEDCDEEFEIVN